TIGRLSIYAEAVEVLNAVQVRLARPMRESSERTRLRVSQARPKLTNSRIAKRKRRPRYREFSLSSKARALEALLGTLATVRGRERGCPHDALLREFNFGRSIGTSTSVKAAGPWFPGLACQ